LVRATREKIISHLIILALKRALNNKCPHAIPRSGEEGAKIRCYSVEIFLSDKEQMLLSGRNSSGVSGLWLNDAQDAFVNEGSITLDRLTPQAIKIRRYYGYYKVDYGNLWDFLFNDFTGIQVLRIKVHQFFSETKQFLFNRGNLITKRRFEILRILVAEHTRNDRFRFSSFSIMELLHSILWFRHPEAEEEQRRVKLYLESFVDSGEIRKAGSEYEVTGKALVALEQYEDAERRHKDNWTLQLLLVIATIALVLAACFQAFIASPESSRATINSVIHP
jgi:hypothetical protein